MAAINWAHGVNGDWTTGADWSGGVAPGAADSVTINAAGTYEVTLFTAAAATSLTINDAGATFYDAGSLNLTGTLALQAGTLALAYGAINGGTLALSGGTLLEGGGLLDRVAVQGTLDMSRSNSDLMIRDGMLLSGTGGSGAGSVTLTGGYSDLAFLGSQTLDHATISIGATGVAPGQGGAATLGITHLAGATSGATLTLGAGLWLHDVGGQAELAVGNTGIMQGPVLPDALVNLGTITVNTAGGTLTVAGSGNFANQGTIAVANGATLDIATAGFTNTGLLSIAGATLDLGGTFSSLRLSQLGNLQLSQATIEIVGTADNTGNTLTVGAGSSIGPVALGGTILNGIVLDTGGGLSFAPGTGILDGVTYQGALSLASAGSAVTLTDNAHVIAAGGGTGAIAVTGAGSALLLEGIETLNTAVISLGNAGAASVIGTADAFLASSATTATLGAALIINQTGPNATLAANGLSPLPGLGLSDTLVNRGTINGAIAGGTLALSGYGTFVNQGTIAISNADTLAVGVSTFANAGTLTVSGGATALLGGGYGGYGTTPVWSNSGVINVAGGTLVLGGAMRTSQLGSITVNGGAIVLAGTLSNAASTLTLGTGSGAGTLASASLVGTIVGGTVVDAGGLLSIGTSGTALLDGVSYQGTLALTQTAAYLRIRDGLSLAGSANITGAGSVLAFQGTQVFDHAQVALGAAGTAATIDVLHDYTRSGGSTLSLGAGLSIHETGAFAAIGRASDIAGDGILNLGSISGAVSGGMLTLGGADFINAGTIAISNGDTLSLSAAMFSNTGTLSVTNAALSIAGSTTLAGLGHMVLSNATLGVSGILDSTGGTLAVGTGSLIGQLNLTGTLRGGTIMDTGSGLMCQGNARLDGVSYRGTLDLSRPFAQLALADGLNLTALNGSTPGTIQLTGPGARLITTTTQTLDNLTINIGSPGIMYGGQRLPAPELATAASTTLTLGAHATVKTASLFSTLGDASLGRWSDTIVNDGQILSSLAGGTLTLASSFFTNTGIIASSSGGGVLDAGTAFTNTGTISVGEGSSFQISLYDYYSASNAGSTVFTNAGTIQMQGGLFQELTSGGLFPNVPVVNQAGAKISGFGIVFSQIANAGTIQAAGGSLALLQSITGTGALLIGDGASLEFGNAAPATETVTFANAGHGGTLKIDQPSNFLAPIAGFTTGDIIDLTGASLTGIGISGGTLVASTASQNWRIATTTPLSGALSSGRDVHGGATIAITPQAIGSGTPAILAVGQPNMLFWASPVGDVFQGPMADMNGALIGNWTGTDTLDITDVAPAQATLLYTQGSNTGTLAISSGGHTASVSLTGSFNATYFHLATDGHGGTLVSYTHP